MNAKDPNKQKNTSAPIILRWWESHEPGIHYAHHAGRVILLRGFPRPSKYSREFEIRDGRGRIGLIQGLQAAKDYALKHLETITR